MKQEHFLQPVDKEDARFALPLQFTTERIIDQIHFASKEDAPLLQLADACAFGLRRYVTNQTHGPDFAKAIMGKYFADFDVSIARADGVSTLVFDE